MTSPESTAVVAASLAAYVLLLVAALLATIRAGRARREMQMTSTELASRAEQLRLLNSITLLLSKETRLRGVARVGTEFFVREMGAERAVFWQPDSQGEPQAPSLSVPANDHRKAPARVTDRGGGATRAPSHRGRR